MALNTVDVAYDANEYHPHLSAGSQFLQWLIPPRKCSNHERLNLRIPDTIVVASPAGPAVWYYTDGEGRVCATKLFSKSSVIKNFGNARPLCRVRPHGRCSRTSHNRSHAATGTTQATVRTSRR